MKLTLKQKQASLEMIKGEIENCKICKKGKIGRAVPGEGSANAKIVFLGEAPGKTEAETGRPFIGRAGKVLRGLIQDVGLKEDEVFITSPVKYLPKYVTPTEADIKHGFLHLDKQLGIIQPKVVVLMGRVAALAILKRQVEVSKEHGKIIELDERKYLLTYHPAAPLYSPKVKPELVKDFRKIKKLLK
ncbi:MAG: uracil-DNA glycosylase [Candidatus Doudnabacteria bacterium]|nr:uracil-DNA glycosylase [Candidatus Doudnabacteria bacterium]